MALFKPDVQVNSACELENTIARTIAACFSPTTKMFVVVAVENRHLSTTMGRPHQSARAAYMPTLLQAVARTRVCARNTPIIIIIIIIIIISSSSCSIGFGIGNDRSTTTVAATNAGCISRKLAKLKQEKTEKRFLLRENALAHPTGLFNEILLPSRGRLAGDIQSISSSYFVLFFPPPFAHKKCTQIKAYKYCSICARVCRRKTFVSFPTSIIEQNSENSTCRII